MQLDLSKAEWNAMGQRVVPGCTRGGGRGGNGEGRGGRERKLVCVWKICVYLSQYGTLCAIMLFQVCLGEREREREGESENHVYMYMCV